MANVFPVDYPRPDTALQLETTQSSRFSILFRDGRYPMVLGTTNVYRTQRIFTRDPNTVESVIDPTDTRLYEDLRRHVQTAVEITLTRYALRIIWPQTVTIGDIQNAGILVFEFEWPLVGYGSHLLDSTRSGPRPPRRTQG
jgi:hypothetical protein